MNNLEQKALHDATLQLQQSVSEKFDAFVSAHPEQARNLELPDEVLEALVPSRIRKVVSNPANLEVSRFRNSDDELSIIVVEHDYSEQLTDKSAWEQWRANIEAIKKEQEGNLITFLPEAPEGINRLHARFGSEVDSGRFSLSDRILMTVGISVLSEVPDALYVGDYDGEVRQGIGSDFYQNTLPEFARKLGVRFITGLNDAKNISFFVNTIGRYTYWDIKPEHREQLFPDTDPNIASTNFSTVQFLFPEDKEKYVIPRETF